jgi:hypothetical protein
MPGDPTAVILSNDDTCNGDQRLHAKDLGRGNRLRSDGFLTNPDLRKRMKAEFDAA